MNLLFIGAHPDDIELACAGTIMKLRDSGDKVYALVFSKDSREKEQDISFSYIGVDRQFIGDGVDGYIRFNADIVGAIDNLIDKLKIQTLFTHDPNDHHQDHKAVALATIAANRGGKCNLVHYPSWDLHTPFEANMYVDISNYYDKKESVLEIYKSQKDKPYFKNMESRHKGYHAEYVERFRISHYIL